MVYGMRISLSNPNFSKFVFDNYSNFMKNLQSLKKESLSYAVIGILNTGIHFVVFWTLSYFESQALSNLIAFTAAVIFSFFANSVFTFKKKFKFSSFCKMYLLMGALAYGSGVVGDVVNIYPLVTFVCYCGVSYIVGFFVSKYFVFK